MTSEIIARAIRAALEELSLTAYDSQGGYTSDVSIDGFDAAEKAALAVLEGAEPEGLTAEDYELIYGWGGQDR
jgi:hypothetical protein